MWAEAGRIFKEKRIVSIYVVVQFYVWLKLADSFETFDFLLITSILSNQFICLISLIAGVPGEKPEVISDIYQILPPNFLVFSCEWLGEFDIASKVT